MTDRTAAPRRRRTVYLLLSVLLADAGLLAWVGFNNAPVSNEASHLAAGVFQWHFGSFDLYRVNPPLVRTIAALSVLSDRPETDWHVYRDQTAEGRAQSRPEFSVGIRFVRLNRDRIQWYFAWARWACVPFSLVGGYFCWRWASELHGKLAGATALALWCLSPNIIAWSATICPDAAAAALGVAGGYCFWRWLRGPDWFGAISAGVALGLALLTKMTWIILLTVWPVIWVASLCGKRGNSVHGSKRKQALQLLSMLVTGILVLNMGYAFEGTFTKLRSFTFTSRMLAGADCVTGGRAGGNRFDESWLGELPVPFPRNYLRGIDLQKTDFEKGLSSYLFGQWKDRGWWYYYLVCAALKMPLGTWLLGFLTVGMTLRRAHCVARTKGMQRESNQPEPGRCAGGWLDEVVLLLPAVTLVVLVSSQTGFSRHFRYVLPAFPFFFIWISKVACAAERRPRTLGVVVGGSLIWMASSSLWVYPHSMSYFNELAGGPKGGHRYLLDSNLDWGQDLFYLKDWCERHPEARPLHALFKNSFSDGLLGIETEGKPPAGNVTEPDRRWGEHRAPEQLGPIPGWHACSVHRIHAADGKYAYFRRFTPVAMAGYSFWIYHITLDQANRVRDGLGLPQLPVADHSSQDRLALSSAADGGNFVQLLAESVSSANRHSTGVRVSVFDREGRIGDATKKLAGILDSESTWTWKFVSPADIQDGELDRFDVVVFPGGSGSKQAAALGDEGKQAVRRFVQSGGGYVGICGGAFLATAKYDWSLALVNAKTVTGEKHVPGRGMRSMAARGAGTVKMKLTDAGIRVFGNSRDVLDVQYSSGPILLPAGRPHLPEYVPLAMFRTEIWEHESQRGTMINTPAIIAGQFGKGRVIVFSPHPELTDGLESLVTRAVLSTARKPADSN